MKKNEYLEAIKAVGNILQYYDSDKEIPALGYGAMVSGTHSDCFALNGDIFDPECDGLEGVIEAYKNSVNKVTLNGPTKFAPMFEFLCDMAEAEEVSQTNQKYFICLIITDGAIHDLENTIDQVVRGSSLPVSFIIVGVGSADFSHMDTLDSDDTLLYSKRFKKHMEADIVQFVPFREFRNNPVQLARETLDEVPRQLLDYFKKRNITPMPQDPLKRREIQQKLAAKSNKDGFK